MKLLLTGFEPFGELDRNPTEELVIKIKEEGFEGVDIRSLVLPVVYESCFDALKKNMDEWKPDAVLSLGVAVGRSAISVERIAINIQDVAADRSDNNGHAPVDRKIDPEGPDAIFTTLPYRTIVSRLVEGGIPSEVSNTAGTYICNTTMYQALAHAKNVSTCRFTGFIHVPASPAMTVAKPHLASMDVETQLKAVKTIIQVLKEELS
ncbi:pyroglutamyl-peptidase I [Paenalkalicoccus suaedae]|uniref:Pyroglutamyl-peptidase I n=1 Tax=Paenalkalicoccus suaedae TaxID=2592382 RepID=A0A859FGL4_9BACI|nr:pyroglutamyl-peptidase I [Paenalkalicoccus suaedae]QKS71812.1 pyroglutamyl-peptidase I [Paenalkalicoccus suaedae]